jgi:hypothetical protein
VKKTTFAPGSTQQRWTDMNKMVDDFTALEKNLRDLRTVLAVIAYNQDDHLLTVPVNALQEMPKGSELEVSFDAVHGNYNFKLVLPDAAPTTEGSGIPTDDAT